MFSKLFHVPLCTLLPLEDQSSSHWVDGPNSQFQCVEGGVFHTSHHQAILRLQLDILQFNSNLTLST